MSLRKLWHRAFGHPGRARAYYTSPLGDSYAWCDACWPDLVVGPSPEEYRCLQLGLLREHSMGNPALSYEDCPLCEPPYNRPGFL